MIGVPGGYVPLHVGGAHAVARADAAAAVHRALAGGTLYEFAASRPERRELQGRGTAFAIELMPALRIVVRHNRHGGMFARLTGDRFLTPTRAPLELETSLRLADAGVPTPPVIAIVRYPAGGPFERADVATEEIPDSMDLADALMREPGRHDAAALAAVALLEQLAAIGARHHDLNLKNVLLRRTDTGLRPYLLDVDRVTFHPGMQRQVAALNRARFIRSARKWREQRGAPVMDAWIDAVTTRLASPAHDA